MFKKSLPTQSSQWRPPTFSSVDTSGFFLVCFVCFLTPDIWFCMWYKLKNPAHFCPNSDPVLSNHFLNSISPVNYLTCKEPKYTRMYFWLACSIPLVHLPFPPLVYHRNEITAIWKLNKTPWSNSWVKNLKSWELLARAGAWAQWWALMCCKGTLHYICIIHSINNMLIIYIYYSSRNPSATLFVLLFKKDFSPWKI